MSPASSIFNRDSFLHGHGILVHTSSKCSLSTPRGGAANISAAAHAQAGIAGLIYMILAILLQSSPPVSVSLTFPFLSPSFPVLLAHLSVGKGH